MKVKAHQKPETGNSEDGNKEWNANMAPKLFSEQKEGLLYQQNPVYAVFNPFGGGTWA